MRKKILLVFGTRPEFIKMYPLVKELQDNDDCELIICNTGQHKEMVDELLELFDVSVQYSLEVMKDNQSLSYLTSSIINKFSNLLDLVSPDLIFVQGDTTTTFSCCLASFYKKIPVAHVEAGLRTNDIYSPWPEEANRTMISRICKYNFAPTQLSKEHLLKENIADNSIYVVGNTVIDAAKIASKLIKNSNYIDKFSSVFKFPEDKKLVLITVHRRENHGDNLISICSAIQELSKTGKYYFVFPVHPNPNVKHTVHNMLGDIDNILLLNSLSYLKLIYVLEYCNIVMTDSGGIQEEAAAFSKPVFVLRNNSERMEGVVARTAKIIGVDTTQIVNEVTDYINGKSYFNLDNNNVYGDGFSSKKIVDILEQEGFLCSKEYAL